MAKNKHAKIGRPTKGEGPKLSNPDEVERLLVEGEVVPDEHGEAKRVWLTQRDVAARFGVAVDNFSTSRRDNVAHLVDRSDFGGATFQGKAAEGLVRLEPALRHGAEDAHDVPGAARDEELFPVAFQSLAGLGDQMRCDRMVGRQIGDEVVGEVHSRAECGGRSAGTG